MLGSFFKNKLSYEIDTQSKIVLQEFSGEITTGDLIKSYKQVMDDSKFDKGYNWVVDLRRSRHLFKANQLSVVVDFIKSHTDYFHNSKMAFIIASPKHVMGIDVFMNMLSEKNINILGKKVINKETAYSWLCN
jgi:hypothetical protein